MDTNLICNLQSGICEINQNYYTMCRPTLFPLRFIGGPPGLWQFRSAVQPGKYRQVFALIMMIALNMGAIGELVITLKTSDHTGNTFSQKINMLFVLAITMSGTISLDILWWRRCHLKELLGSIDYEPKMCDITDANCSLKNQKEIHSKTIKLFIFMLFFTAYIEWLYISSTYKSRDPDETYTSVQFHLNLIMFILGFLAIYPFSIIMSFYISLSWIFRLKIQRAIKCILKDIELAQKGKKPAPIHAKSIELWVSLYMVQFKKYNLVFKQIGGLIYLVMVLSVLSLAENSINSVLSQSFVDNDFWDLVHEIISLSVLVYFLYSLSNVEYTLRRFVKLLYRLSLSIKFVDSSDSSALDLSEKVIHN